MNTLVFLCGAGVGALIASILMIVALILSVQRKTDREKKAEDYNAQTVELMRERNEIDTEKALAMHRIAELLSKKIS